MFLLLDEHDDTSQMSCVEESGKLFYFIDYADETSDRVFVPPWIIDQSYGYRKEPKKIKYYKSPPNKDKAVVRFVTFNLYGDGLEVFNSVDHGSVYAISLTVNNALNKLRNTPSQTCRLVTIPSSKGAKSNPLYRRCMGIIEKAINEEGKKGFYIWDEEEKVLYHYYYAIHCHCFDLVAAMQFYDRPGCSNDNIPCFQHNCAAGVYNPIVCRYTFPDHNLANATTVLRNIGRFSTHFNQGSICRAGPFIAAYANELLYPSGRYPAKHIVDCVERYLKKPLSQQDQVIVSHLFKYYCSLGPDLFLHIPIEAGLEEKREYQKKLDPDKCVMENRTNLVEFAKSSPLPPDSAYAFDFMHGVANAIKRVMSYIRHSHISKAAVCKKVKGIILSKLSGLSDVNEFLPFYDSIPDSVITEASRVMENETMIKKVPLMTVKNIFEKDNFNHLKCYDKMSFAFQLFPIVFSESLHISVIKLFSYAFQIIGSLYNLDADMKKAYTLQNQLLVVLSTIEGIVHDRFSTISLHFFAHCFDIIKNAGPIKNLDTYYTEHSYKLDSDIKINSRNVIKTLGQRMLFMTYAGITTYYYKLTRKHEKLNKEGKNKREKGSLFTEWKGLMENDCALLKYLTKQNYQDDYVYSRFDVAGFVTTLDCFCSNGFKIDIDRYPSDVYYSSSVWESVKWNTRVYSQIYYQGEYYYAHSYDNNTSPETFIKSVRAIAYNKGFKQDLRLMVMLGFIRQIINKHPYVQAICYVLKAFKPLNVCSPLVVAVKKADLVTLSKDRLCLVSCNSIVHNQGRFYSVNNSDYLLFTTNSNYVRQSKVISFSESFDNLQPKNCL